MQNAHFVHEGIQKKYFLQIHDNGANGDEGDGYDHGDDRRGLHLIPSFYLFKAFCLLFAEIGANVGIRLVQARHRFRRLFRGDLPRLIVERRMGSILIIGKIFRARLYHAEPAAPVGRFQLDRAQVGFFRAAELAQRKEDVSAEAAGFAIFFRLLRKFYARSPILRQNPSDHAHPHMLG